MEELSLFDFPQVEINKPIRLIELFGGIGSQAMALRDIGANFEHYRLVEFDKYAVASYNAIHGTNFTTTDIRDVHGLDMGIVNRQEFTYLLTYSFPCFTGDTLVLSKKGYKQFSELKVGDVVLTKSNTWHPIVKKFDNGVHKTCYINSFGFKNLHCTLNHEFYVREMYRKYPRYQNGKRGNERHFKEPVFKQAKDLTRKDYFGIPVIQEEKSFYTDDLDFWYMLGFYIGDGWLSTTKNEIKLACNDIKLEKLKKHLDIAKWNYTVNDLKLSCHKLRFMNKEVYEFIGKYVGTGSTIKHIPGEVLLLPKEQLSAFFEGYCDSDGNTNASGKHDYIRITSVNKNLIYSTSMIVNKLYHRPVSINVDKPRLKKHLIDGREIKQNYPVYEMKFKLSDDKQDKAFYENGYIWFPFYELKEADFESVYNIEVEDDHSYIAQGCISKNCTDLSVAGKMKGMSKEDWKNGNSTRSGLLWEVERILKELKDDELPQVLLMENVPQVHSEQNIADFESWLNFLRSRGYYNFYQDLNAKDYGIPQNRERCFCVSILSPEFIDYEFPEAVKLDKVMRDFLEDQVDEKYYIKSEKADKLIAKLIERGELKTEQNRTDCATIDLSIKKPRVIGIANCITARTDRGISNIPGQGTGILEIGYLKDKDEKIHQSNKVYGSRGIAPTINANAETHHNIIKTIVAGAPMEEKIICRMTGRNPDNPKSRTPGLPTEQMLEPNAQGICGALTTVQKDNLVLESCRMVRTEEGKRLRKAYENGEIKHGFNEYIELEPRKDGVCNTITTVQKDNLCLEIKQATKEGSIKCKVGGYYDSSYPDSKTRRGRVQDNGDTVPTLTASSSENINYVETVYRIRKLTPKECGRLMGYCDFDIGKTLSVNSNSQVYRQFGNAIVKQVLMAIFLQLGIKGLKKWNDRTPEEREKLVMGSVYDKEFE